MITRIKVVNENNEGSASPIREKRGRETDRENMLYVQSRPISFQVNPCLLNARLRNAKASFVKCSLSVPFGTSSLDSKRQESTGKHKERVRGPCTRSLISFRSH